MNINFIAAEIARRRKDLADDSAENVEQLIRGMLSELDIDTRISKAASEITLKVYGAPSLNVHAQVSACIKKHLNQ